MQPRQLGPYGPYGAVRVDAPAPSALQLKPLRQGVGAEILGFLYRLVVVGLLIGILVVLAQSREPARPTHACQPSPMREFVGVGHGRMVDAIRADQPTELQAAIVGLLPAELQTYASAIQRKQFVAKSSGATTPGNGVLPPLTQLRYQKLYASTVDLMMAQLRFDISSVLSASISQDFQSRARRLLQAAEEAPVVGPLFKTVLERKRAYHQHEQRRLSEDPDAAASGGLQAVLPKFFADRIDRSEHHSGWRNLPQYCAALQTSAQCSAPNLSWKSYVFGAVMEVGTLYQAIIEGQKVASLMAAAATESSSSPSISLNVFPGADVYSTTTDKLMKELQETIAVSFASPCTWTKL